MRQRKKYFAIFSLQNYYFFFDIKNRFRVFFLILVVRTRDFRFQARGDPKTSYRQASADRKGILRFIQNKFYLQNKASSRIIIQKRYRASDNSPPHPVKAENKSRFYGFLEALWAMSVSKKIFHPTNWYFFHA